jgi:hypothetical protein
VITVKEFDPATAADVLTGGFDSAPLVGNPRRTRGLAASMLERPAPVSTMVGNPRRTRRLDPAILAGATAA